MRISLLPFAALAACSGAATGGVDDSAGTGEFCSSLADGGQYVTFPEGGNDTSGALVIRVLTDESTDPNDPLYVAFKSYSLQNVVSGGVKTTGQTTGDGLVDELLGAGTWAFIAVYTRGSLVCTAEIELPLEANSTTYGCPIMTCP